MNTGSGRLAQSITKGCIIPAGRNPPTGVQIPAIFGGASPSGRSQGHARLKLQQAPEATQEQHGLLDLAGSGGLAHARAEKAWRDEWLSYPLVPFAKLDSSLACETKSASSVHRSAQDEAVSHLSLPT